MRSPYPVCLVVFALILTVACKKSSTSPSSTTPNPVTDPTLASFIVGASAGDGGSLAAVKHTGTPPAASTGPSATLSSPTSAGNGNTTLVVVQSGTPFKTVYVSIAPVTTAAGVSRVRPSGIWLAKLASLFEVRLSAATVQPADFLQIDVTDPLTVLPVAVTYSTSFPISAFDLQVQIATATGAIGPAATVHKVLGNATIELIGRIYGRWIGSVGPGSISPDPIFGAVVSTTLDGRTAMTDANGFFDLQTNTSSTACYGFTVVAPGWPGYGAQRKAGSTALVAYTLGSIPQFPIAGFCN